MSDKIKSLLLGKQKHIVIMGGPLKIHKEFVTDLTILAIASAIKLQKTIYKVK